MALGRLACSASEARSERALHTRRRELEDETGTGKKTSGKDTRDIPGEPGRKRDTRAHIEMVEYGYMYTATHNS